MFPLGIVATAAVVAAVQRRRAQRRIARELRTGQFKPSPVGRKEREVARRLREQQPPPPPPPPPPPLGGGGGGGIWRGPFRETWQSEVPDSVVDDISGRTGYSENEQFQVHFEVLHSLDPEADQDTLEDMWADYLQAFVNGEMTHDTFFEIWNIDPRDFDWEAWRDAMGYGHNQ